jgi:hypothetical protein
VLVVPGQEVAVAHRGDHRRVIATAQFIQNSATQLRDAMPPAPIHWAGFIHASA